MRWADGDNSLQLYRVYALNPCQETEHTLCGDMGNRRIEPSPLTKRLSPLCLSICVYKAMCVCYCLMASALTGSVYLSFCLPPLVWQPVCLWTSVDMSPCGPLAVPSTPSRGPLSCLPKCPPAPPLPWCMRTSEDLFWSKGFLINPRYLTHQDQRPTESWLYQRSQFSLKLVRLCIN